MPSGSRLGRIGGHAGRRATGLARGAAIVLATVAAAGCFPAEGWQHHRLSGTLVDAARNPLPDYRVAVVPDGRKPPGSPDETMAKLGDGGTTTSDSTGHFTIETTTSTGCLANVPAMLIVGPPVLVARAITRGPGEPLWRRGPPETWGERAVCMFMCTGIGCDVPRVYGATLFTKDGAAHASALRVDAALYYTGMVEEEHHTPDGVPFSRKVATYDIGRVVLPPAATTP